MTLSKKFGCSKHLKVVKTILHGQGGGGGLSHPIPGPLGFPFLGHLPLIDGTAPQVALYKWAQKYGPIYKLRFGGMRAVVLSDPYVIAQAFAKTQSTGRPPLYVTTGIMDGCGVISVDGALWKEQRCILINCLKELENLKTATGKSELDKIIEEHVDTLVKKFGRRDGSSFDVHSVIRFGVANLMSRIVLGRQFGEDQTDFSRQLDLCDMGFSLVQVGNWVNYFPWLRHYMHFYDAFETLKSSKAEHHEFLVRILEQQIEKKESSPKSLIDIYIKEMFKNEYKNDLVSKKQMLHVLADVFGASSETIKLTSKWSLLHLLARPDIQKKVQHELDTVIGKGRNPKIEDMPSLPYTRATVLEAIRMANVVPIGLPHYTVNNMVLGSFLIPKRTMIIGLYYAVHMDSNYWQYPALFTPERFLDEQNNVVVPHQYLPFSSGQRSCVGKQLVEKTLFLIISNILHRYTLEYPTESDLDFRPSTRLNVSPNAYLLKAVPRSTSLVNNDPI